MHIENINSPTNMKGLSIDELNVIANEMRNGIQSLCNFKGRKQENA